MHALRPFGPTVLSGLPTTNPTSESHDNRNAEISTVASSAIPFIPASDIDDSLIPTTHEEFDDFSIPTTHEVDEFDREIHEGHTENYPELDGG
jgi:hypothetical protein